jgi:hypothetical protein
MTTPEFHDDIGLIDGYFDLILDNCGDGLLGQEDLVELPDHLEAAGVIMESGEVK